MRCSGSHGRARAGVETALAENLWGVTIDLDQALLEWLQKLGGRVPGRLLATSGTFQYFAAAAPGARELVSMVKIWELTGASAGAGVPSGMTSSCSTLPPPGTRSGLLGSPHTFGAITRVGPIFGQAERVRDAAGGSRPTGYLAVAQPTEMAVGETIDLSPGCARSSGANWTARSSTRRCRAGSTDPRWRGSRV